MAPRVIHYTPEEIVWECKTCARCECSGMEWPTKYLAYQPGGSFKTEVAKALEMGDDRNRAWHDLICQFSARQMPDRTDLLQALSPLARRFASPAIGKYLAGIWESQLPDALEWTMKGAKKPAYYRAPSWSWAALDGEVNLISHGGSELVEYLEADCIPAFPNAPYGGVVDGYVVVKGEFGPAGGGHARDFDVEGDVCEDELWALKLNMSDWNIWHSLLLRPSWRVEGAWERIGFGIEGDRCFDGRGKSVVKIV